MTQANQVHFDIEKVYRHQANELLSAKLKLAGITSCIGSILFTIVFWTSNETFREDEKILAELIIGVIIIAVTLVFQRMIDKGTDPIFENEEYCKKIELFKKATRAEPWAAYALVGSFMAYVIPEIQAEKHAPIDILSGTIAIALGWIGTWFIVRKAVRTRATRQFHLEG